MKKIFEGGCQCGAIAYRVTGVPVTLFACHCTECQRQSSSAFGMALWVKGPEVKLLSGQLKEWVREMPSGKKMSCQYSFSKHHRSAGASFCAFAAKPPY